MSFMLNLKGKAILSWKEVPHKFYTRYEWAVIVLIYQIYALYSGIEILANNHVLSFN